MKLEISNWLGGISFSDRLGREGSYFIGKAVNPFNTSFPGYLCPGPEPTTITNTVTGVVSSKVDAVNNKGYFVGGSNPGKITQLNLVTELATFGTEYPHNISNTAHAGHSASAGEDCIIYPVSSTHYLLYSWNDNTDGDVGRVGLSGALTFDDDFLSSASASGAKLTGGVSMPHPMLEWGESGFLYIADGRNLHQFDGQTGANGTFTANKFQLPYGWVITSLFDANDFIGICAKYFMGTTWSWGNSYKGRTTVFFWDGVSSSYNKRISVEDPQIKASGNLNGEFYIFTLDANGKGNIKRFDGNRFIREELIETNVSTETTGHYPASYGSVIVHNNMFLIGTKDLGNLFMYGSPKEGISKALINLISFTATNTEISAPIHGLALYFGTYNSDSGNYGIRKASLTGTDSARIIYKSLYYELPQKARINYAKLYFRALTSGQGDDVFLDYDYGAGNQQLGNISFAEDGGTTVKKLSGKNIECNNFRIVIQKDEGAGIKYGKIIIDYDILENSPK